MVSQLCRRACPRYNIVVVVHEDVKKPNKQTNLGIVDNFLYGFDIDLRRKAKENSLQFYSKEHFICNGCFLFSMISVVNVSYFTAGVFNIFLFKMNSICHSHVKVMRFQSQIHNRFALG